MNFLADEGTLTKYHGTGCLIVEAFLGMWVQVLGDQIILCDVLLPFFSLWIFLLEDIHRSGMCGSR